MLQWASACALKPASHHFSFLHNPGLLPSLPKLITLPFVFPKRFILASSIVLHFTTGIDFCAFSPFWLQLLRGGNLVLPISVPRTSYSAQDTVVERMCAAETCSPPLWYVSGYLLMIPRWHPLLLRASGVTGGTLGGHGTSSSREPDTHPALGLRCVEGRDVALQGDALWHAGPCACFSLTEGGVRSALRQGRLQWKERRLQLECGIWTG